MRTPLSFLAAVLLSSPAWAGRAAPQRSPEPSTTARRPASAVLPPLSDGGWDISPSAGFALPPIERRFGMSAFEIAEQAARAVRREAGARPPLRYVRPQAPRVPNGTFRQPDHLEGTVDKILWALAAQVKGRPERELSELPSVGRRVGEGRANAFSLAPMPDQMLGAFEFSNPAAPRVLFSERLHRLQTKGVPSELLASVAAHELDHADAFYRGDARSELAIERRAFQREAAYLRTLGAARVNALLEEAASSGDKELAAFYANEALILEADRQGVLDPYIERAYGIHAY